MFASFNLMIANSLVIYSLILKKANKKGVLLMDNSIYAMLLIFFGIFHENFGILEGLLTTVHVITG